MKASIRVSPNTNYFVDTTRRRFVLTLIEQGSAEDLEFSCQLCLFLHAKGLSSPRPMIASDGSSMQTLRGRPAVLVERIEGHHVQHPNLKHCAAAGAWLGQMHKVVSEADMERANPRGYQWFFRGRRTPARPGPARRRDRSHVPL